MAGVNKPIKGQPDGSGVGGYVYVDLAGTADSEEMAEVALDVALTPCVVIQAGRPAEIAHWVLSQRTKLDTRPRAQSFPYRHIGIMPPDLSLEDWGGIRDIVKEAADVRTGSGQKSDWLDGMVDKIDAALETEDQG